jgi:hypothetical protein
MSFGLGLLRTYGRAIRDEPKLRAYTLAALVDDVGVAVSAWGGQLLMVNLFTDQRQRARLMLPTLLCFLVGCLIAGPLADWGARRFPAGLARHRWRVVVWGRVVETVALGMGIFGVAGGAPTIARMLPYFMISAFMKTALRPTRIAFEVDLLRRDEVQLDERGAPMHDERGQPRMYKVHLLAFDSLTGALRSVAVLGGLLLGGKILGAVGGRYAPLFAFDVATNVVFIGAVLFACHPERDARAVRLGDLFGDRQGEAGPAHPTSPLAHLGEAARELGASLRDAARFLASRDQRPLLWLLCGWLMIEWVNEFYSDKMIVKHVLHRSDDEVRHAQIAWSLIAMFAVAALPALARRVGSLGKIFLVTMVLDGAAIALARRWCAAGAATRLAPFVALLGADKAMTEASGTLASLATNSASSGAMRGRIAATFGLVAILGDMASEAGATAVSERIGIPAMLFWIGVVQMGLMVLVALAGGRRLWRFGLRSAHDEAAAPARASGAAG